MRVAICASNGRGNIGIREHSRIFIKGIRPVPGRFGCPNALGLVRNRNSNPGGVSHRDLTYCSHKPECIGTTNPDRSVLITIITWHFQFHPVNISNLHVKGAYVFEARAVTCSSHCYVTSCPLTTGIVASQYPSSRDAELVRGCLSPLISACLNTVKATLPQ